MAEKNIKKRLFHGNFFLLIVSLVIAVVLWLILSITAFPEVDMTLKDVNIDFSLEGSYADLLGLSVITSDVSTASVSFSGRREDIGKYTADDVHISLGLENVRGSGTYNIPLTVTSVNGDQLNDVEIAPQYVHIVFDKLATKILSVDDGSLTADLSNVIPASNYVIDPEEVRITPSQVEISGPKDYIDQVTSCVLTVSGSENVKGSYNVSDSKVTLYNGTAEFSNDLVSMKTSNFMVYIPVYYTRSIPLTVTLTTNNPAVDINTIPYTLSLDSMLVRGQDSDLELLDEINIGYIDVTEINIGKLFTFPLSDTSSYTNISGVDSVQVSFELDGYATKRISIPNSRIYTINGQSNFTATVEQDRVNVTVVGPEDELNELDSSNFIAQINLMDYELSTGPRILTCTVCAPNHPKIWAAGLTQALVSFEAADAAEDITVDGEE